MHQLLGNHPQGHIFVLSAPAGTGKTTLVEMLTREFTCVVRSISYTTRSPREGEADGVDYYFVDEKRFQEKIQRGDFIEFVTLYGHRYGTDKQVVEKDLAQGRHVVLVIDTQGAEILNKIIEATYIFVMPPDYEELEKRLKSRETETPEAVEERLAWAKHELDVGTKEYDYLIINDNLEIAYQILKSIVIAEEHRKN